jgi:hypothetical protein
VRARYGVVADLADTDACHTVVAEAARFDRIDHGADDAHNGL